MRKAESKTLILIHCCRICLRTKVRWLVLWLPPPVHRLSASIQTLRRQTADRRSLLLLRWRPPRRVLPQHRNRALPRSDGLTECWRVLCQGVIRLWIQTRVLTKSFGDTHSVPNAGGSRLLARPTLTRRASGTASPARPSPHFSRNLLPLRLLLLRLLLLMLGETPAQRWGKPPRLPNRGARQCLQSPSQRDAVITKRLLGETPTLHLRALARLTAVTVGIEAFKDRLALLLRRWLNTSVTLSSTLGHSLNGARLLRGTSFTRLGRTDGPTPAGARHSARRAPRLRGALRRRAHKSPLAPRSTRWRNPPFQL